MMDRRSFTAVVLVLGLAALVTLAVSVGLAVYVAATADGYAVMPGALARISLGNDPEAAWLWSGDISKDTWVISREPVEAFSLLSQRKDDLKLRRGTRALPSRAADNLFWLGRYIERLDSAVRMFRAVLHRLIGANLAFEGLNTAEIGVAPAVGLAFHVGSRSDRTSPGRCGRCFIGSRCIVVEGVRVEKEAVLGANVVLTASTPIIDVTGTSPKVSKGRIPRRSVVIPGTIALLGTYSVPWGGTPLDVRRAYPDKAFRNLPDGSLLVIDTGGWYKLCCPTSQLWKPDVLGAIYRVRRVDAASVKDPRGLGIDWRAEPASKNGGPGSNQIDDLTG